jgi:nitroreductase
MARESKYSKLEKMFLDRWSPRSFLSNSISEEDAATLFEAARWSPSCFNDQPWLFLYARNENADDHNRFASAVVEGNRVWAANAPLLAFAFARKAFAHNDKPNAWAEFDSGAAWMSLCLQAHAMGLSCHGMGGIDAEKAHEVTGVPKETYKAICGIAIGRKGDPADLPEGLREREGPSDRRALDEIAMEGRFRS